MPVAPRRSVRSKHFPSLCELEEIYDGTVPQNHDGTLASLGGGNSNIFGMFTPKIGEDEPILTNIFQRGWFNHQLVLANNQFLSNLGFVMREAL